MSDYSETSQASLSCISAVSCSSSGVVENSNSALSGYSGGDEAAILTAGAESADTWGAEGDSAAAQASTDAEAQLPSVPLVVAVAEHLSMSAAEAFNGDPLDLAEQVGDSDDVHAYQGSVLEGGSESDTESTTMDEGAGAVVEQTVSNLKRRRVYAYSPNQRPRI